MTRKQSVPGRVESPSPSSSPVRGHVSRASTSGATAPLARRQSLRASAPVFGRAAAMQRRDSPLSNTSDAESDARAEAVALIEDLKVRLTASESQSEQFKRQSEVLQSKLDEVHKEQAKLEEKVHEGEEHIEVLQNEKRDTARQMREMETIYEAERSAMTREKEEMANREEEMQMVIQRLKDTLAQRINSDDEPRQSRQVSNSSPSVEGGSFAPPSSVQRSDSRNSSKLLLQKDKLIESLRLELAEAQIKLVETENQGGGRLQEVERLLVEARMANARLMEDNESYQLLLQEKTLNGDFAKSDFGYMAANQDTLNALEGHSSNGDPDHPERLNDSLGMSSLADELSEAQEDDDRIRRLETENKALRDENKALTHQTKALTLYINKIIERLLQHQEFEHILDQSQEFKPGPNTNKDLPLPPPQQQQQQQQPQQQPQQQLQQQEQQQSQQQQQKQVATGVSFLQRAKSIAIGSGSPTPRPKARPMSVAHSTESAHTDPERAPSIPLALGRSTSVRRSRPMSEQFIGAANVVNQMYRGPEGHPNGPTSPSLVSPRSSIAGPFFPKRSSSGAAVATSGNFPGMRSETSSTISSSADSVGLDAGATTPGGNSPPRSRDHNNHEKIKFQSSNKPRPLRLVQENNDAMQQSNKRSSWFGGWMGKKEDGSQME